MSAPTRDLLSSNLMFLHEMTERLRAASPSGAGAELREILRALVNKEILDLF